MQKGALRNFTKFTGKHLSQSVFFNKVAGSCSRRSSYYSGVLFTYSENFRFNVISKEKNFVEWKICIQDCIQQSSRLDQAKFTSVMYFNFQFNCFIITLIVFMVNLIFIKILLDRL